MGIDGQRGHATTARRRPNVIPRDEIETRARTLGLDQAHVRKDYLLNCLVAAIADHAPALTFRGGTALARIYWPDFRLSEDLDFITSAPGAAGISAALSQVVAQAARQEAITLELELGRPKQGWTRSTVRSDAGEILIDINLNERAFLPVEIRELDLPYSDLQTRRREIACLSVDEILGNKWFMLGDQDRNEPRDLFDLWAGLVRFGVPFGDIARGHQSKYGFAPQRSQLSRARRLEPLWTVRLEHQQHDIPPFAEGYAAVRAHFERWHKRSSRQ